MSKREKKKRYNTVPVTTDKTKILLTKNSRTPVLRMPLEWAFAQSSPFIIDPFSRF